MLTGPWMEGIARDSSQSLILAQDWDEKALLVLTNIIHGQTRPVPRRVTLEFLAKMTVLVDY